MTSTSRTCAGTPSAVTPSSSPRSPATPPPGAAKGARKGYRTARTDPGETVPPHAVDTALAAYRDEGRRLVAAAKAAELVERALRGAA